MEMTKHSNSVIVDKFLEQVEDGRNGKTPWIPIGFTKMGNFIGITQRMYYLIGGMSGTGKTAFVDLAFVLNPYKHIKELQDKQQTDYKIRWIYRSMERSVSYKIAKWVAQYLYVKYRLLLDVPNILGWGSRKNHISQEIYDKIKDTRDYLEEMLDFIEIIEGPINPTGIYAHIQKYASYHGKIIKTPYKTIDGIERTKNKYIPNDDKLITIIVEDHLGRLKGETREGRFLHPHSKELIDTMSDYNSSVFRDFYGFSIAAVSQFNRGLEETQRRVKTDMTPLPSDFKSSGNIYEDSDISIALYNPYKLKDLDHMGYDIESFVDKEGFNRFRACYILKNSFGNDDIGFGYNFIGECGYMRELPKSIDMTQKDYIRCRNP